MIQNLFGVLWFSRGINAEAEKFLFVTTTIIKEPKTKEPKFCLTQWVSFVGGEGIVRSYNSDAGTWTYLIEMTLGSEPNFGRVGAETMVLLHEVDLRATPAFNEVELRAA